VCRANILALLSVLFDVKGRAMVKRILWIDAWELFELVRLYAANKSKRSRPLAMVVRGF
jgi:hypothetical protein